MVTDCKTEKKQNNREVIKVGQSNANVPGTYGSTNQHANQENENLKKTCEAKGSMKHDRIQEPTQERKKLQEELVGVL